MEEKVKLHIDTKGYKEKELAKKEFGRIKNRVQRRSPPVEVTLLELIEKIQEGKSVSPAVVHGTEAKDFEEQQVFMVDIDNKRKDIPILTVEEAISICEKNCLPLAFYYFSFSHKEELPKYRLVFVMNEVIKEKDIRDEVMQKLINLFEQADISCDKACHVFFGTDKGAVICDLKARINVDTVKKIPSKSVIVSSEADKKLEELIMGKKGKLHSSRTDKELEKLINGFDFFSYLKERNGAVKYGTGYVMFENCEICGHHDDLVYYPETNTFNCFDDDGKVGGTIIDYLVAVEKITRGEAIKKFKKELCRKMSKELELICMDDVEIQEVKWLWYPYIPAGKLTILQGDPR